MVISESGQSGHAGVGERSSLVPVVVVCGACQFLNKKLRKDACSRPLLSRTVDGRLIGIDTSDGIREKLALSDFIRSR